jgi:vacuolar-type H+-ATPase subunit C/Vma6
VPFGAEVAVGYLIGVEYAVKNLRILLVAKETGADTATLNGRLRENYV